MHCRDKYVPCSPHFDGTQMQGCHATARIRQLLALARMVGTDLGKKYGQSRFIVTNDVSLGVLMTDPLR